MSKRIPHSQRQRTKFKAGAELKQPQSPAGVVRSKKGKLVNMGLADPLAPSWRSAPFVGTFKLP